MTRKNLYLLFVYDASQTLQEEVASESIQLSEQVRIVSAEFLQQSDRKDLISSEALLKLSDMVGLSVEYDGEGGSTQARHAVRIAALALQLVKPTRHFQKYWIEIAPDNVVKYVSSDAIKLYATNVSNDVYLRYQQHHVLDADDICQARKLIPGLSKVLQSGSGSWRHPYLSVHRATLFFGQGYGVNLGQMRQFLWASGLDCLFSSKIDRSQWGAKPVSRRICKFLGEDFRPYEFVDVPSHQARRQNLTFQQVGKQIFKLRNAYVHGLKIPSEWLTDGGQQPESGRAYQLLECTEIVLRVSLRKVLKDRSLLDVFSNPVQLDRFFST